MKGIPRWTVVLALLTLAGSADAARVVLRYAADAGCPSREAFAEQVRSRTVTVRKPTAGQPPWQVSVRLLASGHGFEGSVRIDGPDGGTTTRHVSGGKCAEVASALALITAFTVESPAGGAPAVQPRGEETLDARPPLTTSLPDEVDVGAHPVESPWMIGLHGAAMGAAAPGFLRGGTAIGGFEPTFPAFAFRLRVEAVRLPSKTVRADGSDAALAWSGLRLESCPLRWGQELALLLPCGTAALGRLEVSGRFEGGEHKTLTWADVGASSRLELMLSKRWFVDMRAAAVLPLVRHTLVFDGPRVVVHDTPPVGALFSAGLGMRFP